MGRARRLRETETPLLKGLCTNSLSPSLSEETAVWKATGSYENIHWLLWGHVPQGQGFGGNFLRYTSAGGHHFFFTLFLPKWPGGGSATLHQPNTSYSLEDQTCLIHQPQPAPLKGDCIWKAALAGRSALQKQLLLWRSSPSHQPMQQLWPNLSANLNNIDPTHQHTIANTGQT